MKTRTKAPRFLVEAVSAEKGIWKTMISLTDRLSAERLARKIASNTADNQPGFNRRAGGVVTAARVIDTALSKEVFEAGAGTRR